MPEMLGSSRERREYSVSVRAKPRTYVAYEILGLGYAVLLETGRWKVFETREFDLCFELAREAKE